MSSRGDLARSAVVLAGGRSSRMGRAKAALEIGGTTLLARTLEELGCCFEDIVVVVSRGGAHLIPASSKARVVFDEIDYEGPVTALARGLDAIRADAAFACSCDLPMLDARVIAALCGRLGGCDAVIPIVGGKLQPLHAVYRRRCAAALRAMLARGERRLSAIAGAVNALEISENELRALDPELRSFFNLNTPEDYVRARALMR